MAKYCETCRQSYPDHEPECPHCAALVEVVADDDLLEVVEEPAVVERVDDADALSANLARTDSSSAIDLGEPAVADLVGDSLAGVPDSGASTVAWSSLVQDAGGEEGGASGAAIDSPSDRDLLRHVTGLHEPDDVHPLIAGAPPAGPRHEPHRADEADVIDLAAEASAVDLGAAHAAHLSPPSDLRLAGDVLDDSSSVDLGALAEAGRAALGGKNLRGADSSDVNFGAPPAPGGGASASGINLAGLAEVTEVHDGADEEAEEVTEFADVRPPHKTGAGHEGDTSFLDDLEEVEAGSAVNLGAPVGPGERPSSRDLIAEAVESGVDLGGESALPHRAAGAKATDDDSAIDLGSVFAGDDLASSPRPAAGDGARHTDVDLGMAGSASGVNLAGAPTTPDDAASVIDMEAEGFLGLGGDLDPGTGSSAVDLAGRKKRQRGGLPESEEPSDVNLDDFQPASSGGTSSDVELARPGKGADAEDVAVEADELIDDDVRPTRRTPARAPALVGAGAAAGVAKSGGGARRWVGGGLVGALAATGACVALWSLGVEPPNALRLADKPTAAVTRPGNEGKGGAGAVAPPAAVAPASPTDLLGAGNFAQAVEALKDEPDSPEVHVQRGSARWLGYLQDQMTKKAPLSADDDAVKLAHDDLAKAAAEGKNPEAVFYLGQMEEWTKGVAEARKRYEAGLREFQDNPAWKKRFQAALDRLDSRAGAEPGVGRRPDDAPDAAAQALVALLVAFQVPAADDEEAGYDFWAAVKLARAGKYPEAIKALDEARKVHGERRFARLRKAQNPLSDPTEEIFLRSCDELKAYWQMQASLGGAGIAKGADVADTLKQLRLEADKAKEARAEVAAARKDAEAARTEAKGVAAKAADADKAATAARAEAKALDDKLKEAGTQLKTAEGRIKGVEGRLEAAGVKADDPAKGVDQLAAARREADRVLDQAAEKLAGANFLTKGDRAELVKGVERAVAVARSKDLAGELKTYQKEIGDLKAAVAAAREEAKRADPKAYQREIDDLKTALTAARAAAARVPGAPAATGNPLLAEAYYGAGMRHYWSRRYAEAEKGFAEAAAADNQDARYFYFLGLARVELGKADDASADFERGARLEAEGRPGRPAISAALERVQGAGRQAVNRFRP